MQEPIVFQIYKKLKAGEAAMALAICERQVKKQLFNDWLESTDIKHRPQASPGDVPLPLDGVATENGKAIPLPGKVEIKSLGKPYKARALIINPQKTMGTIRAIRAMFKKTYGGQFGNIPGPKCLQAFLGFKSPAQLNNLYRTSPQIKTIYGEYLVKILGDHILVK